MPTWNVEYFNSLRERLEGLQALNAQRLADVTAGRVAPGVDDIAIGSGKLVKAVILFFDIRGFTDRTGSSDEIELKKTLSMLNQVIPTVMRIIFDFGGYVEKNTGDGVMAIFGIGEAPKIACNNALSASTTIFYVLKKLINPALNDQGIAPVNARIGMDYGPILLSRIGTASGSSAQQRNFLTAVGPPANIASKLQGKADTDQIWTGDLVRLHAEEWRKSFFVREDESDATWKWIYSGTPNRYAYWNYNAFRKDPSVV